MAGKKLPPIHDVVRFLRPTVDEIVYELVRHWTMPYPGWNYVPVQQRAPLVMAGAISRAWVLRSCDNIRLETARKSCAEVLGLVFEEYNKRRVQVHGIPGRFVRLTPRLLLPVNLTCQFVEGRVAKLFWVQPRKSFGLTEQQFGFLAAVIKEAYDEYEGVVVELFDTSAPFESETRAPKVWTSDKLHLPEVAEIEYALTLFASAYRKALELDIKRPKRPTKKKPDGTGDLFDKKEDDDKKK